MKLRECQKYCNDKLMDLPNSKNQTRWLLCHLLDLNSNDLILGDKEVGDHEFEKIQKAVKQLNSGTPLAYIIGSTQFFGLDFKVTRDVLIPRNDTEVMVQMLIDHVGDKELRVLDLCCGSGIIGICLKKHCENAKVTLLDISENALSIAKENAKINGVDVSFIQSDFLSGVHEKFDIIVSNPPYIPTKEIEKLSTQVKNEPMLALDGMEDGLFFYKKLRDCYKDYLSKGIADKKIFLEIGFDQGEEVSSYFPGSKVYKDLQGRDRIVVM